MLNLVFNICFNIVSNCNLKFIFVFFAFNPVILNFILKSLLKKKLSTCKNYCKKKFKRIFCYINERIWNYLQKFDRIEDEIDKIKICLQHLFQLYMKF